MSITCSLCGKKQSGFIQDFPISNKEMNVRICSKCNDIKSELYKCAVDNLELYETNRANFEANIKDITDIGVISAITNILDETDLIFKTNNEKRNNEKLEAEKVHLEKKRKDDLLLSHMITTGYNFEDYKIIAYNGVISGEVVLGTGFISNMAASFSDFFGMESNQYAEKIEDAKQAALHKLIKKSIDKGDNGLIGIDFDIIVFSSNMIGVSANATSVKVVKIN
jgi:uncharacterized protein YbjQ (UPF0145 family)